MPNVPAITLPTGGAFGYSGTSDPQQDSATHALIGGGGGGANVLDTYIVRDLSGNNNVNDIPISTVHGYGTLAARPGSAFEGYYYFATDTNILYRWTSGIWQSQVMVQAGTGLTLSGASLGLTTPVAVANGGTGTGTLATSGQALISDGSVYNTGYPIQAGWDTLLPSGAIAQTNPRQSLPGTQTLVSGTLVVTAIDLPKGVTITSITYVRIAVLNVPVHQIFGLYDSSKNLLRSTVDDGATAWTANSAKTLNLTSTFVTTYRGLHYIAGFVQATGAGTLGGITTNATASAIAPNLGGTADTGLTTALPNPFGAITNTAVLCYAYVS